ncbi:MAG: Flp pilus assembly protein CpaB [Clostridiales bacterium]|nr:Flp pilus assembly protein CpaB [Clostridiales bacterium]
MRQTRRQARLFLFLSIILAAIAFLLGAQFLSQAEATGPVIVAAKDLAPYTVLTSSDVTVAQWPVNALPPNRYSRPEEVVGKTLLGPLAQGQAIMPQNLGETASQKTGPLATALTELKEPRMRALTLSFSAADALGGQIRPGDRVDIIATIPFENEPVTRTILEQVLVLRTSGGEGGFLDSGGNVQITLAVPAEAAQYLVFAQQQGKLVLMLNPYQTEMIRPRIVNPERMRQAMETEVPVR